MTVKSKFPELFPSIVIDFANSRRLDDKISFTRNSIATYVSNTGYLKLSSVNSPRFDHDPETGRCLGLLLEASTTNGYRATNFSDGYDTVNDTSTDTGGNEIWDLSNVTFSSVNNDDPFGSQYAVQLNVDSSATQLTSVAQNQGSILSDTPYTVSVWAKAGGSGSILQLASTDTQYNEVYQNFDLINGVLGNSSDYDDGDTTILNAGMKKYKNGWYRCFITYKTINTIGSKIRIGVVATTTSGHVGAPFHDGNSLFLYGAQWEQNDAMTSYIPCGNTLSTEKVTREADYATISGDAFDFFNHSEGTLYLESLPGIIPQENLGASDSVRPAVRIDDGSGNNVIEIQAGHGRYGETTTAFTDRLQYGARFSGFTNANNPSSNNWGTVDGESITYFNPAVEGIFKDLNKSALSYSKSDYKANESVNGKLRYTNDHSVGIPSGANTLRFGSNTTTSTNITINRFAYYSRRITNEEMNGLTK